MSKLFSVAIDGNLLSSSCVVGTTLLSHDKGEKLKLLTGGVAGAFQTCSMSVAVHVGWQIIDIPDFNGTVDVMELEPTFCRTVR